MAALGWTLVLGIAVSLCGALCASTLAVLLVLAWSERPVRLPIAVRSMELGGIRHLPSRTWLGDHVPVLAAGGLHLVAIHIVESVVRPGRAAVAWFAREEGGGPLGVLVVSPSGRSVTFQSGRGPDRVETTTGTAPLLLRCREDVARVRRDDLSDPLALLAVHQARCAGAPPPPATTEEMAEELAASYASVVATDQVRRLRTLRDGVARATLRGRAAAVGHELRDRFRQMAEDLARP